MPNTLDDLNDAVTKPDANWVREIRKANITDPQAPQRFADTLNQILSRHHGDPHMDPIECNVIAELLEANPPLEQFPTATRTFLARIQHAHDQKDTAIHL